MKKNKLVKKLPNFSEEKRAWEKGYRMVVCFDEAGRGPVAGPVVAAAVALKEPKITAAFRKLPVKDSKDFSEKKREEFYDRLINHPGICWGVGRVSEKVIDKKNILESTKLAMLRALRQLEKKSGQKGDFLILDGNFTIDSCLPQKPIIKGDKKVFSCAAASIIAKVTRDRLMINYCRKYPLYGFGKHKGYLTKDHFKALKKHGSCKIHRRSFSPVKDNVKG